MKKDTLNTKAMHVLVCVLSSDEYNRVCNYEVAKEIRDVLEVTHEGTN